MAIIDGGGSATSILSVAVKGFELVIGIAVVCFVAPVFIELLNSGGFNYLNGILDQFSFLMGTNVAKALGYIILAGFIVYVGRWVISRSSANGGQTPNNKGN